MTENAVLAKSNNVHEKMRNLLGYKRGDSAGTVSGDMPLPDYGLERRNFFRTGVDVPAGFTAEVPAALDEEEADFGREDVRTGFVVVLVVWSAGWLGFSSIRPRPAFFSLPSVRRFTRTASRIPFTKSPLLSVLKCLAISIASLIVTLGGISGKYNNSLIAIRIRILSITAMR